MGLFDKIGSAFKGALASVKNVVSNPIVEKVANLVAPRAYSALKLGVSAASTFTGSTAAPAVKAASKPAAVTAAPRPVSTANAVSSRVPASERVRALVARFSPTYGRNTVAIGAAFKKG